MDKAEEMYLALTRGAVAPNKNLATGGIITPEEIKRKLSESIGSDPLSIYAGFDPTNSSLTVGHLAVMKKLLVASQMGHKVTFVTGTATVLAGGDPTDRLESRKPMSLEQITSNAEKIQAQALQILGNKVDIKDNYSWWSKLNFQDIIKVLGEFPIGQLMQAAYVKGRQARGTPIGLIELGYPVIMGYDAYVLKSDFQYGGLDQLFNLGICTEFQKRHGQRPQSMISLKLAGLKEKEKISKSDPRTYLPVSYQPVHIYKALIGMQDKVVPTWLELYTEVDMQIISELEHRLGNVDGKEMLSHKKLIAMNILKLIYPNRPDIFNETEENYHNNSPVHVCAFPKEGYMTAAELAKQILNNSPDLILKYRRGNATEISLSQAKTLIQQGAVKIDGVQMKEMEYKFTRDNLPDEITFSRQYKVKLTR